MKTPFVRGAALVVLLLFGSRAAAQPTAAEVAHLKKEVAELRAEVAVLKKEMALLKSSGAPAGKKLTARLEAAALLTNPSEREKAYIVLSVAAARAGDAKGAKKALDNIFNPSSRETCTYKAAILLAQAGQTETALAFANRLFNPSQRQKALAKIAKGEVDD